MIELIVRNKIPNLFFMDRDIYH